MSQLKKVTQKTFDLPTVPDWVQYLAVDKNSPYGTVWGYSKKPLTKTGFAFWPSNECKLVEIADGYQHTPEPVKRPEQ